MLGNALEMPGDGWGYLTMLAGCSENAWAWLGMGMGMARYAWIYFKNA